MGAQAHDMRGALQGTFSDGVELQVVYRGERSEKLPPTKLGLEAVSMEVGRESLAGRIPVGALVTIRFVGERVGETHSIYCRCEERRELLKSVYVVFRYEGSEEQTERLMKLIEAMFNRRGAYRVKPPLNQAPACRLSLVNSKLSKPEVVEGRIEDLSATGCGIRVAVVGEKALADDRFVSVTFDDEGLEVTLVGEIVYRMLRQEQVRYGVRFSSAPEGTMGANRQRDLMRVIMSWQRMYISG